VSLNDAAWVEFGYVLKAHGVLGDIRLIPTSDFPLPSCVEQLRVVPRSGAARVLALAGVRSVHGAYLLRFAEVKGRDAAETLKGASVQLHRDLLPPLAEGEYFLFELRGASVVDEKRGVVGEVEDLLDNGGQVLLKLDHGGEERLLPCVEEWMRGYDRQTRRLAVSLPDGLWED
jgi:16S rRNA processing protein RimM